MADRRTRKDTPFTDESEYYSPLREKRGVKNISHFKTPVLKNPDVSERAGIKTTKHIWKYGDRFYKLADQYYGDPEYWWVIAWYNGVATETQINTGYVLFIPLNLADALDVLGV
jgi:nucleoid-associated protein YgaU